VHPIGQQELTSLQWPQGVLASRREPRGPNWGIVAEQRLLSVDDFTTNELRLARKGVSSHKQAARHRSKPYSQAETVVIRGKLGRRQLADRCRLRRPSSALKLGDDELGVLGGHGMAPV